MFKKLLPIFCVFVFLSCQTDPSVYEPHTRNPALLHRSMKKLSDVIVHDIFSPPVASRIYVYPSIAAYECIILDHPEYQSLAGQLHELEATPKPADNEQISFPIASVHAFLTVGKALIFSEDKLTGFQEDLYREIKKESKIPTKVLKASIAYGEKVARHVLEWAGNDKYNETRTFPKYSITDDPSKWKPTPPGYMDGIEPHWKEIRPFVIESSDQFVPLPPTSFDMTKESKFYNEVMEVYTVGGISDDEKNEIAKFWDCNPFVLNVTGHVMHATKKITPGGHWVGITRITCEKSESDFMKTVEAYTLTTIALADAFISCWDEKYRSNLIRPETVINEYIDEEWVPALQTPPFPEHTSGHSVISRAAAVALTSIYGDNFAFDDHVEVEYGLPVRSFRSFYHASEEAAVSRLYGGIHYRPAIDYGVDQGEKVGNYIINKLKLKK